MVHVMLLVLLGLFGGAFGALVGLGGGVFIIPGLTLFLGVPIHTAVAASLMAVMATSATATAAYVRKDLTNLRLGLGLEAVTVIGALGGGLLGVSLGREVLSGIFGGVMIPVSIYMAYRHRSAPSSEVDAGDLGRFGARYFDLSLCREVSYRPHNMWAGMASSGVAGVVSGLLGVGGGFLKMPVMVLAMGVPARAAVSTSSLMVGITASVTSLVYFARGMVDPFVAVPVVLGVMVGAYVGSKLTLRIRSSVLQAVLAVALFVLAVQMILSAAGIVLR
jgi:uncharacterized membrane protein YfcA